MAEKTFHSITLPGQDTARVPLTAAEFSTSVAYKVKDYCTYQGKLYRCTTAHAAGAWNAAHFTATDVDAEFDRKLDIPSSQATAPANPRVGDLWIDNDENSPIYNVDTSPTLGSTNAVQSGGTKVALNSLDSRKMEHGVITGDFSASVDYRIGDLVFYATTANGITTRTLYRCTTDHNSTAWNPAHFIATTLEVELQRVRDSEVDTDMIGDLFGTKTTYAVGDYCIYNDNLYRCIQAVDNTEVVMPAFDPDDWTQVALANDVSDLNSASNNMYDGLAQMVQQKVIMTGNVIDTSDVTIKINAWITENATFKMDDGHTYFQNPFIFTGMPVIMRFYPKDKNGNAITMSINGGTAENITFTNGYAQEIIVNGTTVRLIGYGNQHDIDVDFKRMDKTYTLASPADHWVLGGKASSTTASLNVGLTVDASNSEYVPYAEPTYEWEYVGLLKDLPYIDAEDASDLIDVKKVYKLNGELYFYDGTAWSKLQKAGDDSYTVQNRDVFFTTMKYNETNGSVENRSNVARTLSYIPTNALAISVDGTYVTGIEILAWNQSGVYVGTWNPSTEVWGTTAAFTSSVNLSKIVSQYPDYKFKINVTIATIAALQAVNYVSWELSKLKEQSINVSNMDNLMSFDSSKIEVIDGFYIVGNRGILSVDSGYVVTNYIDVSNRIGNTISFNTNIVANPIGFSVYDKGKNWIDGLWGNSTDLETYGYVSSTCPQRITWVLKPEACYIRLCMNKYWYTQPSDFNVEFYSYKQRTSVPIDTNFITIAHKGYANTVVEDTLPSFVNAAEAGFKAIEIDARRTSDGVYVIAHNDTNTLYKNGTGTSVTISTTTWADMKGATFDSLGNYPICTLAQVFNVLRHYRMDYFIIDLKTGSNAEIMDVARRCGVINQVMLSYYNASSFINDLDMLQKYPKVSIRFSMDATINQFNTILGSIKNQLFADINISDGGAYTYFPRALSLHIPILCSGVTKANSRIMAPIAAGAMAQTVDQYSPLDFINMISLDYTKTPTLTTETESVSLTVDGQASVTVTSDINEPACYPYGYSSDWPVFSVAQNSFGNSATFSLRGITAGSANFIVFTATGEQIKIPVTVA